MTEAVEFLFNSGFGGGEGFGDFAVGEAVEAKVEEGAVVGVESRDEAVVVGRGSGGFVGDGVVHPIFEGYERGFSFLVSNLGDGGVESNATHPSVGGAFMTEGWPRFPKGSGDFLVEVADAVGLSVGEVEADLEDGALAVGEHFKELAVFFFVFVTDFIKAGEVSDTGQRRLVGAMRVVLHCFGLMRRRICSVVWPVAMFHMYILGVAETGCRAGKSVPVCYIRRKNTKK